MKNAIQSVPIAATAAIALSSIATGCLSVKGTHKDTTVTSTGTHIIEYSIDIQFAPPQGKKNPVGDILEVVTGAIAYDGSGIISDQTFGVMGEDFQFDSEEDVVETDYTEDDVIWTIVC